MTNITQNREKGWPFMRVQTPRAETLLHQFRRDDSAARRSSGLAHDPSRAFLAAEHEATQGKQQDHTRDHLRGAPIIDRPLHQAPQARQIADVGQHMEVRTPAGRMSGDAGLEESRAAADDDPRPPCTTMAADRRNVDQRLSCP